MLVLLLCDADDACPLCFAQSDVQVLTSEAESLRRRVNTAQLAQEVFRARLQVRGGSVVPGPCVFMACVASRRCRRGWWLLR